MNKLNWSFEFVFDLIVTKKGVLPPKSFIFFTSSCMNLIIGYSQAHELFKIFKDFLFKLSFILDCESTSVSLKKL